MHQKLLQRHGSFVWDQMTPESTKKFIDHYSIISAEEGIHRQEVMEADRLASEAAKLLEDTNIVENTSSSPVQNVQLDSQHNQELQKDSMKVSCSEPNSQEESVKKVLSRKGSNSDDNKAEENTDVKNSDVVKSDNVQQETNDENKTDLKKD